METYALNVGEDKRRGISWHAHKQSLVSRVADVCMWWVRLTRQAKQNEKLSGVDGSLTVCEDAQKESENKA